MCVIPQLVSALLNPIPSVEHFRRSYPQCEHSCVACKVYECICYESTLNSGSNFLTLGDSQFPNCLLSLIHG